MKYFLLAYAKKIIGSLEAAHSGFFFRRISFLLKYKNFHVVIKTSKLLVIIPQSDQLMFNEKGKVYLKIHFTHTCIAPSPERFSK